MITEIRIVEAGVEWALILQKEEARKALYRSTYNGLRLASFHVTAEQRIHTLAGVD